MSRRGTGKNGEGSFMRKKNVIITGFDVFDDRVEMKPGQLILLAGRPAMGKTAFAMTIADHICRDKECSCIFFSMELSEEQFFRRMLAMNYGIETYAEFKSDEEKEDLENKIALESDRLRKSNVYIENDVFKTEKMEEKVKEHLEETPKLLIIVDYLQLINMPEGMSYKEAWRNNLLSLKKLAEKLNCAVLVLAQLPGFKSNRSNKRPTINDVLKTNNIDLTGFADKIVMMYRDEMYDTDTDRKGIVEFHAVDTNTGEEDNIDLRFSEKNLTIREMRRTCSRSFVIKNAKKELKAVCMNGLKEKFGKNPPEAVKNRLIHELDVISKNHHATYYLLASKLAKEAERLHQVMMIRGVFTSSLTAYTSGISDINPMEKEYGGINLPFESTCEEYAVKEPCLDIQCSVAFIQFAQVFLYKEFPEYRQIIYPLKSEGDYGIRAVRLYLLKPEKMPDIKLSDADKCNPESFFDYMFLQGFFHITFINDITMELMRNSRYSDLDFDLDKADLGVSIADLWKYSQKMDGSLRDFRKLKVKTYEELIKVKSMAYSTDVWDGLLKEMVLDKRLPLSDVIGSRERVYMIAV